MSENEVCSEFKEFIPPEEKLNDNIPFGKALSLEVKVSVEKKGKVDVYIDDFIGVTVDINNKKSRLEKNPCTVIHAVSHTSVNNTFVPRKILIEKYKCRAEGSLSEIRTCLGWSLDTRKLLIKLPSHKCKAWINDFETFINKKSTSLDDLKSLIGKLENVIIVI